MSTHNGPDRTLWYNQDPGTLFSETSEPLTPEHVDVMVDEVADAEVDVFLVNVNMWRTNYPSEVWETWWDGFDEWAAANPPLETDAMARTLHWHHPRHPKRHRMIEQMQRLAEQGCDYLERSVQHCRDRGVSPAVSIRMNDTHDSEPDSQYFSDFYRNHPELWLSSSRVTGTGGLDYDQAGTRDHYLALVEEVVTGYDLDILELDYLRHAPFFDGYNVTDRAPVMTDYVVTVARLCRDNGVQLIPRVPATPALAHERGLDVESWVDQQLIDGLTVGTAIQIGWQLPVDSWRRVVGELPLNISIDKFADSPSGFPTRELQSDDRLLAGVASAYAPTDINGLYFFNFFGPRERPIGPHEPHFDQLPAVKSDDVLAARDAVYLVTTGRGRTHAPQQLPLELAPGDERPITMTTMDETAKASCRLRVLTKDVLDENELWLQLDDTPVGSLEAVEPYERANHRRAGTTTGIQGWFTIPVDHVTAGEHSFIVRNRSNEAVSLHGIELHITA